MANTTFNGPVRSENGFKVISTNSSTGAVSTSFTLDGSGMQVAPVALADSAAISLTAAAHGGRISVVPALGQNCTLTLPSPSAGVYFKIIYGGSDTNFYIGGIVHLDSNADNVSVYSDGNSNSILTLTDFGIFEINILAKDSTNWYIWGNQEGADAPAFTDQS